MYCSWQSTPQTSLHHVRLWMIRHITRGIRFLGCWSVKSSPPVDFVFVTIVIMSSRVGFLPSSRILSARTRNKIHTSPRARLHTSSPATQASILFALQGLSNSRETQHFNKLSRLSRVEHSPSLKLIQTSEIEAYPLPSPPKPQPIIPLIPREALRSSPASPRLWDAKALHVGRTILTQNARHVERLSRQLRRAKRAQARQAATMEQDRLFWKRETRRLQNEMRAAGVWIVATIGAATVLATWRFWPQRTTTTDSALLASSFSEAAAVPAVARAAPAVVVESASSSSTPVSGGRAAAGEGINNAANIWSPHGDATRCSVHFLPSPLQTFSLSHLLHRYRSKLVQLQHFPQYANLRVIAVVLHATAPHHLPIVDQELAADLHRMATAEDVALANTTGLVDARVNLSDLAFCPRAERDVLHVLGPPVADVQVDDHAKLFEQGARGIGENGERAVGELLVMRNQVWLTAADDDDAGRDRDGEIVLHRNAGRQRLEIRLTGATVEVADEDDQLALMRGIDWIEQSAERSEPCIDEVAVVDDVFSIGRVLADIIDVLVEGRSDLSCRNGGEAFAFPLLEDDRLAFGDLTRKMDYEWRNIWGTNVEACPAENFETQQSSLARSGTVSGMCATTPQERRTESIFERYLATIISVFDAETLGVLLKTIGMHPLNYANNKSTGVDSDFQLSNLRQC
nr:hypothetical protein CFP56_25891 [Quercus suber]